jgi:hypothetical protein
MPPPITRTSVSISFSIEEICITWVAIFVNESGRTAAAIVTQDAAGVRPFRLLDAR